jgi:DNA-binding HxlR family transcriptional regulator
VAEIKSTLDIVMEKTKHLALSEEEKREQKKKEAKQSLAGLLQKYLDKDLNFNQLKDKLNELKESYDYIDTAALVVEVLDRIDLDYDNTPFLAVLDEIGRVDIRTLTEVLSDYQKTVRLEHDKRSDQAKEKLAYEHHISGSAISPNIAADVDWVADLQRIQSDFNQILNREKAALLKR